MTTGRVQVGPKEFLDVDFGAMEDRISDKTMGKLKKYLKEAEEWKPKEKGGKGVVEFIPNDRKTKLLEQLRNAGNADIKEQWTVAIPALTTKELAAHLRDYVWVTDVIKGKPGDTVNIPYVKDFDFRVETTPGAASLTAKSSLIAVYTTVLKEAGAYTDVAYGDIEKIDANLLDELNQRFARAAVRAEDKCLIDAVGTQTTVDFAGSVGGGTGTEAFYARYVPEAIAALKASVPVPPPTFS